MSDLGDENVKDPSCASGLVWNTNSLSNDYVGVPGCRGRLQRDRVPLNGCEAWSFALQFEIQCRERTINVFQQISVLFCQKQRRHCGTWISLPFLQNKDNYQTEIGLIFNPVRLLNIELCIYCFPWEVLWPWWRVWRLSRYSDLSMWGWTFSVPRSDISNKIPGAPNCLQWASERS